MRKRFFDQPIFIPKLHINFAEFPYLLYFVLNRDFSSWEPVADSSTEWERVFALCFTRLKFECFKGNNRKRNINNWIESLYSNRLNEKVFLKMNLKSIFHSLGARSSRDARAPLATFIRKDNSYSSFLLRNSNLKFNVANLCKKFRVDCAGGFVREHKPDPRAISTVLFSLFRNYKNSYIGILTYFIFKEYKSANLVCL